MTTLNGTENCAVGAIVLVTLLVFVALLGRRSASKHPHRTLGPQRKPKTPAGYDDRTQPFIQRIASGEPITGQFGLQFQRRYLTTTVFFTPKEWRGKWYAELDKSKLKTRDEKSHWKALIDGGILWTRNVQGVRGNLYYLKSPYQSEAEAQSLANRLNKMLRDALDGRISEWQ